MRRFWIPLFFILIVSLTHTSEARRFALLVGVNEYDNISSLKCCVNDMNLLKEALLRIDFKEDDIYLLTTGDKVQNLPTKEKIEQKVQEILAQAGPSDVIFFAFSGHGRREDEIDYFCPTFADPEDIKKTCVSITKVMDDLDQSKAELKWMVVDACRNTNSRDARSFDILPTLPSGTGIVLFQSCTKGEKSYEEDRKDGHGYFTKNLVAALSGKADANDDGKLTLLEVCEWTTAQTRYEVNIKENKTQRPFWSGEVTNYTLTDNLNWTKANNLANEARKALKEGNFEQALKKYDEAIAIYPKNESWKDDRELAQKLFGKKIIVGPTFPESPELGDRVVLVADDVEFVFCWCPPGEFMMGSPEDEPGRSGDETQHMVHLTKGFWMLENEVTQAQWKAIMGTTVEEQARKMFNDDTEYDFGGAFGKMTIRDHNRFPRNTPVTKILCGVEPDCPIYYVSWNECVDFCSRLSSRLNQRVQLPTEAQWEYACRAGSTTALPNGPIEIKGNCNAPALDPIAWYGGNSSQEFKGQSEWNSRFMLELQYPGGPCGVHAVGKKQANAWGLYDMLGNVCEWCSDDYDPEYYTRSPINDPENVAAFPHRVYRSGDWLSFAVSCRSAARGRGEPGYRNYGLGFRVLVVPDDQE